jgi:hypothetical protein
MGTKAREDKIFGSTIRASAERAAALARTPIDWPVRLGTADARDRPSRLPLWVKALNAGYLYLEVRCLGCDTHQTVALTTVCRPKTTPIDPPSTWWPGRAMIDVQSIFDHETRPAVGALFRVMSR